MTPAKLLPLIAAAIIALIPAPSGIAPHAWNFFAIFIGVVLGLICGSLPSAAVGLIGVTTVAALAPWVLFNPAELAAPGFSAPGRAIQWALSGFSNSTVWLAFSAFMFGTAYDRTGLGRRIALELVRLMGGKTLFLGYAVMLSDVILAPFSGRSRHSTTPGRTIRRRARSALTFCGWPSRRAA
jgi:L-tartrate/succinate antiporter